MDVTIDCGCPPKDGQPRHSSDTVTLHEPILPIIRRALLYDLSLLGDGASVGDQLALLSEGYVLRCIDAWTLVDDKGKPVPPSRDNIRTLLLERPDYGDPVAKAADDLYSEAVLLPLLLGASTSSSAGRTGRSTSPATNGQTPHKKRSTRSSITSSPMVVTGPMQASSGGGSSS
jgi:hypothetical protein